MYDQDPNRVVNAWASARHHAATIFDLRFPAFSREKCTVWEHMHLDGTHACHRIQGRFSDIMFEAFSALMDVLTGATLSN